MVAFLEKLPWRSLSVSLAFIFAACSLIAWICLGVNSPDIYSVISRGRILLTGIAAPIFAVVMALLRLYVFTAGRKRAPKAPGGETWSS